ncbi:competence type IV pilus minor pilin ComGF [Bacillus aerolatus]|nr:competence type IV pilus minor pilin ComGF [Bacillus aerolatus]
MNFQDKRLVLKNNNGFTMVESLLVLLIFISVAALFPLVYGAVFRVEERLDPERRLEWELFALQLRKEMNMSHSIQPAADKLTFVHDTDTISIEKYNEGVRRRVGGRGHEMILQEISSVQFYWCGSALCVTAVFKNGEKEKAQFCIFDGGAT